MPGESAPRTVYNDGLIKSPYERWPGPFDAMSRFGIALGIDLGEYEAVDSDADINADWELHRENHPEGLNKDNVTEFAKKHYIAPVRGETAGNIDPGETIGQFSKRHLRASFRFATADTTTQIGNSHASFSGADRFSDEREDRGRFWGWDMLPVCRGALSSMGEWGLHATASTLANRQEQAEKNDGVIGNANTSWGASRDQEPIELRILFEYVNHLYPLPKNFERLDPLERMLVQQEVERKRAEVLIENVQFFDKRYMLWREGADDPSKLGLKPGSIYKHLVRMPNGGFAYRPYDRARGPRDEMRDADLKLLQEWATENYKNGGEAPSEEEALFFFDGVRCQTADGQDFTAADQEDPAPDKFYTLIAARLATIKSTALQYENATKLAYIYQQKAIIARENGDVAEELEAAKQSWFFEADAANLSEIIHEYFVTEDGFCANYDTATQKARPGNALAGIFALSAGVFSQEMGSQMLDLVEEKFGRPGGLVNTLLEDSPQQWDNNAWAIMQMEAVNAAILYGRFDLAVLWVTRWLDSNDAMFEEFHILFEKSDPNNPGKPGGRGEYHCVPNLPMSVAVDLWMRSNIGWLRAMAHEQLLIDRAATQIPRPVGHIALKSTMEPVTVMAARPQSRPRHTSPFLQNHDERHTRPAKTARGARTAGRAALRP